MINVIPAPALAESTDGESFHLGPDTAIAAPEELIGVVTLFRHDLEAQTGIVLPDADPEIDPATTTTPLIELVLQELSEAELAQLPVTAGWRPDHVDPQQELYGLTVEHRRIRIWAPTPEGIYRGLTTLRQLIGIGGQSISALRILDGPRFAWRGFSLDTARRFFPPKDVRQIIDLLTLYKTNVLHIHLTDAEGWRIQIDTWPKLTEIGGATAGALGDRPGGFYTKAEYAELVAYAAARFITIVPEIEMPGHTGAIFKAYPELAGDGSRSLIPEHGFQQYLHPDNPLVPGFIQDVLKEVVAMTPGGVVHIGGDEAEAFGMPEELYIRFMAIARPIVPSLGKTLAVWQEATRSGALEPADLVQYWLEFNVSSLGEFSGAVEDIKDGITLPDGRHISPEMIAEFMEMLPKSQGDVDRAVATGNNVLVSLSTRNYLDTPYAEPAADEVQEAKRQTAGMTFYRQQTVADFYDWEPATVHPRLPESSIIGVEGAIWCESIETFEDAMFLILPRFCGIAERAWSLPANTGWDGYQPRLAAQAPIWERNGWPYFKSSLVEWPH